MSPREKGRRSIGAWVEVGSGGHLRICFRWPARNGTLYRITTEYADTDENRRELERARDLVGAEIRAGIFEPAKRFPSLFAPKIVVEARRTIPIGRSLVSKMRAWIADREKRKVRISRLRDYRSHLKNYFERAEIGAMEPAAIGKPEVAAFQTWLRSEAGKEKTGLTEKTAANVIKQTLRAFLRDTDLDYSFLKKISWEDTSPTREQDPFTAEDRDRVLTWFKSKRPFGEYLSLRIRFLGATPSEVRAFRVGDYDRATGTMRVRRSQHLHQIGATKTRARQRPVKLGDVVADVEFAIGIRQPDQVLIKVAEDTLRDNFTKALLSLRIGHRSLYQTKHTYATLALIDGESPAIVARNLGISLATLEKNYAAALQRGRLLAVENPRLTPAREDGGRKYANSKASPTGFEPAGS